MPPDSRIKNHWSFRAIRSAKGLEATHQPFPDHWALLPSPFIPSMQDWWNGALPQGGLNSTPLFQGNPRRWCDQGAVHACPPKLLWQPLYLNCRSQTTNGMSEADLMRPVSCHQEPQCSHQMINRAYMIFISLFREKNYTFLLRPFS